MTMEMGKCLESDDTKQAFLICCIKQDNIIFSVTYDISNAEDVVTRTLLPSCESHILQSCVRVTLKDLIKPGTENAVSNKK